MLNLWEAHKNQEKTTLTAHGAKEHENKWSFNSYSPNRNQFSTDKKNLNSRQSVLFPKVSTISCGLSLHIPILQQRQGLQSFPTKFHSQVTWLTTQPSQWVTPSAKDSWQKALKVSWIFVGTVSFYRIINFMNCPKSSVITFFHH